MTIVHVDTGRDWRGGQSQVLMLASNLSHYNCNTVIVAKEKGKLAEKARAAGIPVEELPFRFEADPVSARRLARLAESRDRVLFHAHTPHALGQAILAATFGARRPVVFTRRVAFPLKKLAITRWKLHQADRIVAVSEAVGAGLRDAGIEPARIRVIHSAVDVDSFPFRGPRLAQPRAIAVLNATERDKGVEEALQFMEMTAGLPAVFHFIGSGPALARLNEAASKRSNMIVHGFVSEVQLFVSEMYAAVSFSRSEGFPNLLLQCMATGLPVLALRNDATSELLNDPSHGLLFDSPQEARFMLETLLKDEKQAKDLGQHASAFVSAAFSAKIMTENYYHLYREVLGDD